MEEAQVSRKTAILRLAPDKGFPFNLLPARIDRLARDAAIEAFGPQLVEDVMAKYHRSALNYDDLLADLMGYDRVHRSSLRNDPVYQMVYQSIREDFINESEKVIPYTTGAVPSLPDFPKNKSSGLPWKLEGLTTKQQVVDAGGLDSNRKLWHEISFSRRHIPLPDVCLFARAQVCEYGTSKIRATWGYPFDVYIEEARFFYPILDYVSSDKCKFPVAYGLEMANGAMAEIERVAKRLNCKSIIMDWKSFDKTIPPWLIRDSFALIAEMIDMSHVRDVEGKVWPVRENRSRKRWKRLVDYFVETPIRTSKGERFLVTGGVPSGSCFTNIIDSIVNAIVTRYIHYQTTGELPLAEVYLGDDSVTFTNQMVNLDDMTRLADDKFGMIINPKKSFITTNRRNIHFLGYYNFEGLPFKPQDTLIASFIAPERTRTTAVEAAAAALGQLWSGMDPHYATCWITI
nr:putative capsid [Linepithema humile partiti-like virus 1]